MHVRLILHILCLHHLPNNVSLLFRSLHTVLRSLQIPAVVHEGGGRERGGGGDKGRGNCVLREGGVGRERGSLREGWEEREGDRKKMRGRERRKDYAILLPTLAVTFIGLSQGRRIQSIFQQLGSLK